MTKAKENGNQNCWQNPLARSTGRHEPIDNEKKESLTSRLKGDYVKGRRRV